MKTENEKQTSGVMTVFVILAVVLGINYFVTSVLLGDSNVNLYRFWTNLFGGEFWYGLASMVACVIAAIGLGVLAIVSAINKK